MPKTGTKKIIMDKCSDKEFQYVRDHYQGGSDEVRLWVQIKYGETECFNTMLKFITNGNLNNCKIFLN